LDPVLGTSGKVGTVASWLAMTRGKNEAALQFDKLAMRGENRP
jgi:hypothetical protein